MQGTLYLHQGIQLTDLLQMLGGGHVSGKLEVKDQRGITAQLEFNQGMVCAIQYESSTQVAALAKLMKEEVLHYHYYAASPSEAPGIYSSMAELLMEAALWADTEISAPVSQDPAYFTIKNRKVLNSHTNEEGHEILAELDFLQHSGKTLGAALGLGELHKLVLKEEQAHLAFHLINQEEVFGYQSLKPMSLNEAYSLL
jgi:hypothetical protein